MKVGDTIEWKNADIVPHTVTAVDKSFDSAAISPGHSWKFIVRTAGNCQLFLHTSPEHESQADRAMRARLNLGNRNIRRR